MSVGFACQAWMKNPDWLGRRRLCDNNARYRLPDGRLVCGTHYRSTMREYEKEYGATR